MAEITTVLEEMNKEYLELALGDITRTMDSAFFDEVTIKKKQDAEGINYHIVSLRINNKDYEVIINSETREIIERNY